MTNKIYIVAGERNMELAALRGGGLYVNVGQTTRDVEDRLRDDDYKRKAAGGKWKVILQQDVGELTDKDIHPILKKHPRIYWDPDSNNTEEFLFVDDPGDGSVAKKTVIEILTPYCQSLLKKENERLQSQIDSLQAEILSINAIAGSQGIDLKSVQNLTAEREELKASLQLLSEEYGKLKNNLSLAEHNVYETICENGSLKKALRVSENRQIGDHPLVQRLKNDCSMLETSLQQAEKSFHNLLKGSIATAVIACVAAWFCWPQSSSEVPTCTLNHPGPGEVCGRPVEKIAPAVVEPITAPPAPETKNPFHPYSSYEEWMADPDNKAKALAALQQAKKKTSKPKTAEAEATPAPTPRPTQDAPTRVVVRAGETVEAKVDLFIKFETCIYGQATTSRDTISDIMECNNGNELEMKKCLMVADDADWHDSWIELAEASACWKKTH